MKYYISTNLKSKGRDILEIKFGSTNLDTQYVNKATVETVSGSGFIRNMHRKYIVSTFCAGRRFKLSDLIFIHGQSIQIYRIHK